MKRNDGTGKERRNKVARRDLIAALDIGSSKVCCFIGRLDGDGRVQITGIGHQASQGIKAGAIVDMDAAEEAIMATVNTAERMAGETVRDVVVGIAGGQPASRLIDMQTAVNGGPVRDADLRRLLYGGMPEAELGRTLLHAIPVGYSIDGSNGIRDPRGMHGQTLAVHVHQVTAAASAVRNVTTCVERCHLGVSDMVVNAYASGLAALVDDEMELGVTVIDMGGGTTTIAVFYEGNVIFTDVVPVGGGHVTSDIARGLSTALGHAERMKTLYGHALATGTDERETIDVPRVGEEHEAGSHQVPRSLLVGIIQPRLEETLELVRSHLEASGFDKIAGRRVVLTGGACQLPGTIELAGLILDKQVRIGRPGRIAGLAEATAGPAFATCAGLLNYAVTAERTAPIVAPAQIGEPDGLIGRFGDWFREHF
ncbi:MAG: cell division protein FtsA [Alphaproteobacteria bacterium]|nr:cell division protein FtsA [Alphaproteobacteria bacterium]